MKQPQPTEKAPIKPAPAPNLLRRQNSIRTMLLVAAAATTTTQFSWLHAQLIEFLLAPITVIYALVSYFVVKRMSDEKYNAYFDQITTLDAAIIGFILSAVQTTPLPTLIFIVLVQFNAAINGGVKKWVSDNIVYFCGISLPFVFMEPHWSINEIDLSVIGFGGMFAFLSVYGIYLHKNFQRLKVANEALTKEQVSLKLRTYKLSRYLSPTVWKAVDEGKDEVLKTERKRITVFFSDIKGFSSLSEELESETITSLLNHYLTEMSNIAQKHGGTIDKFMGDGLMVLFGDSKSQGLKADCVRAVSMAMDMRKKMKDLQTTWFNQGIKNPLQIRMGINTGYCTVGTFGTSHYMDYTALGTHVNLASRLESACDAGEILISHETWSLVKDTIMCRDKGEVTVKGFSHPIKVYQVMEHRKHSGEKQSYFEDNAQGFSVHMDLEKLRNYDRDRVVNTLEKIIKRIKSQRI